MKKNNYASLEAGFTAVELLITLFIASVFLIAGYQLYSQVLRDGSDADKTVQASIIAYDKLRKTTAKSPCSSNDESVATPMTPDGFSDFVLTTTISCPRGGASPLSRIKVTATYKDGITASSGEVTHATYVYNP